MDATLPAIVAASGLSTRMGTSKALIEVEGRTFLARIMATLRKGGADPILVVVRDPEGPEGEEARAGGGKPVLNHNPSKGPISSLQAGLLALPPETEGALFCPVDHPLFQADTVRALIRTFRIQKGPAGAPASPPVTAPAIAPASAPASAPIIAPTFGERRGHPVLFSRELFAELMDSDLPRGARTVTSRYLDRRVLVEVEDPGILADINTPGEFKTHFP